MSTATQDWTPAELADLETGWPGQFTTRSPEGALVPALTRVEWAGLVQRYPTCFPVPARRASSGAPETDALRARFPSMFPA